MFDFKNLVMIATMGVIYFNHDVCDNHICPSSPGLHFVTGLGNIENPFLLLLFSYKGYPVGPVVDPN